MFCNEEKTNSTGVCIYMNIYTKLHTWTQTILLFKIWQFNFLHVEIWFYATNRKFASRCVRSFNVMCLLLLSIIHFHTFTLPTIHHQSHMLCVRCKRLSIPVPREQKAYTVRWLKLNPSDKCSYTITPIYISQWKLFWWAWFHYV